MRGGKAVRWLVGIGCLALALPVYGEVRVGIVQDGAWPDGDEVRAVFQREIEYLNKKEFGVVCPAECYVVADGTWDGVDAALNKAFANPSVDIVIALGPIGSANVCRRTLLSKPAIAPMVMDTEAQGIAIVDGASGKPNLMFMASPAPFKRDLKAFRELTPYRRVAILGSRLLFDAVPVLRDGCLAAAESLGVAADIVPVNDSIPEAVAALPSGVDAVYIGPLLQLSGDAVEQLARWLMDRKLPSFSFAGRGDVERGILASVNPPLDTVRLARRAALHIQRLRMGESAEKLPVLFTRDEKLTVNMATARAIEAALPRAILIEAELLNEQAANVDRRVNLSEAVAGALASNLEIEAGAHKVAAGRENIRDARSKLLPKIEADLADVRLDKDRAAASAGMFPERSLTATLSFTQVIFAEQAWANLDAQKLLQKAREFEYERAKLDLALEAAKAYLNVLRAKTGER
ncbi:MAG TPA: TolC family protein, partial [Candidatus Hydrogenedentes bacterium]|nr:TolC family protein [Candidatus Hydrogenedentota bacterium]